MSEENCYQPGALFANRKILRPYAFEPTQPVFIEHQQNEENTAAADDVLQKCVCGKCTTDEVISCCRNSSKVRTMLISQSTVILKFCFDFISFRKKWVTNIDALLKWKNFKQYV